MGRSSTSRAVNGTGAGNRDSDPINVEVEAKPRPRRFSAEYKLRVLREADELAKTGGGIGALLRREGLYSSLLAAWRRERAKGEFDGLSKRGPRQTVDPAGAKEVRRLTSENNRLRRRLTQAEAIIEVQEEADRYWCAPRPREMPGFQRVHWVGQEI